MSYRRVPFAVEENYHCFTRGIDGRKTFLDEEDYQRFQQYLYLCNDKKPFDRNNFATLSHAEVFQRPRTCELVAIGSYALMPNHFHIGFQELEESGASKFLQKLGTSYTMYFNAKYERVGALFVGPCRSRHIDTDRYFKRVARYIHLNPVELFESGWKQRKVHNLRALEKELKEYAFSSLPDYLGTKRSEHAVLNKYMMSLVGDGLPPLRNTLVEARDYYENLDQL